ncbi:hypothetical protein QCA50_019459 [Cerrena zonata]|uniref:Importin N-terminal domain-containing protein n=1 Tax=Cerrena zonata TaxID=2478898 RepID=A0AAW0F939_9APHY
MMNEEFEKFLKLVLDQNSSDNNVRTQAELDFTQVSRQDPTQSSYILIELACNDQLPTDIKQSCLLHLKRFVPKFWSLGFESFVGPPISQELKQVIRDKLIQLATSSPESKIRAGSAYVITQIAAADYPDEWPNLLKDLYELTTRYNDEWSMIGGLSVLNELFDDLITEEQFWDGGQPDADDYLPLDGNEGDDDEGWEDMDDIGVPNYEKLKSYVDEEEEEGLNADEDLKNILILFFKECLSKNLGHFQTFYEMLDDDEKKIITENVVF